MKKVIIINQDISNKKLIGEYQGIVTNTDTVDFYNYSYTDYWRSCNKQLAKTYRRVSLIDVIKIKKEFRGMGYGKKLIDIMINKSKEFDSQAVILMADLLENNTFDLINWYKKRGFDLYGGETKRLPIMIKEL